MKVMLGGLFVIGSLISFVGPAPLGPHPVPAPGAVLDAFPEEVYAWHNRDGEEGGPEADLHSASHIAVRGPDNLWLDGTVHVGDHVTFLADHPARLAEGIYKVWSVARWADGAATDDFQWEFTVGKKAE